MALILWFIVVHAAGVVVKERCGAGAADVKGVEVEGVGSIDEAGNIVGAAVGAGVVGIGIGIDNVGVVVDDGNIVSVAVVVAAASDGVGIGAAVAAAVVVNSSVGVTGASSIDCASIVVGITFAFAVRVAVAAFNNVIIGGADAVGDAGAIVGVVAAGLAVSSIGIIVIET